MLRGFRFSLQKPPHGALGFGGFVKSLSFSFAEAHAQFFETKGFERAVRTI